MTPASGIRLGQRLSGASWLLLVLGGAIAAVGVAIVRWASPSPHGYIEFFFGVPLIGGGGVIVAGGLLASRSRMPVMVRLLAWLVLLTALVPIVAWAYVLVRTGA